MLPSLFASEEGARAWNVARAAGYGAALGALAALFKTFGPLHAGAPAGLGEIVGATLGFALLCAGAAALRNFLARRVIWRQ